MSSAIFEQQQEEEQQDVGAKAKLKNQQQQQQQFTDPNIKGILGIGMLVVGIKTSRMVQKKIEENAMSGSANGGVGGNGTGLGTGKLTPKEMLLYEYNAYPSTVPPPP